ncbi:uncharacterized protein LOC113230944 [Hyposmocoma kahamanoa]|uniref:uncharacterized protein LOC113230944 n=1 Tax=Hyposmocoma kahamanoa TaxID=1477025 RepID=UPI000E6D84C3|nr:uncharacterized protein LOC113230944 [Hyposmocoma kahamanoa]
MTALKIKFGRTAVHTPTTTKPFEVEFANIRGLHANLNAVHHHLETARPAMMFLTDVCCRRLRCLEDPSFSLLVVHVDLGSHSRVYVCVYRSHNGDMETTRLMDHLSRVADDAQERFPLAELVFLGDFNAHHELWLSSSKTDHAGRTAHAFALTHDLTQLVNQPTRIPDIVGHAPSLLDLLLTNRPAGYRVEVRAPLGSSDHCLVSSKVPLDPLPPSAVSKRRIWHHSSADWDGMRDYFASVPWGQRCFSGKDPTASAAAVADEIVLGMEYYIPNSYLIGKGRRNRWFNRECASAADKRQEAYRAWIKGIALGDPETHSLKAAYNNATKSCKRAYIRADAQRVARVGQELLTHPTGSRSYWRLAKAVQSNFCQPSLPPLRCPDGTLAHKPQEKVDLLAKLFAANSRIDDCNAQPPIIPHCGHTMPDLKIS